MNPLAFLARLRKASRAAQADVLPHQRIWGMGQDWAPTTYGEYYAKSVTIYSAIKIRADALSRAPLKVHAVNPDGTLKPARPAHPLQVLLDTPNPHMSGPDLVSATETNLCLWGKAYWAIEHSPEGRTELWPIRPDRLVAVPGVGANYIKGYLYRGLNQEIAYLPEEIVEFLFFNPLQDRTGMSPIAPLRLTADMAIEALKFNRNTLRNGGLPDFLLIGNPDLTDAQVEAFYKRWDARFKGPDKAHRPAIATGVTSMQELAFSQREMEFLGSLQWGVEDTARTLGVPQPLLGSLREATLANVRGLERIFWRMTIIPEANMIQAKITHQALPKLGWPGLVVQFDTSGVDVLTEEEQPRLAREVAYLDRGVVTINEVRRDRGLPPTTWGDDPDAPSRRTRRPAARTGPAPEREPSENGRSTTTLPQR